MCICKSYTVKNWAWLFLLDNCWGQSLRNLWNRWNCCSHRAPERRFEVVHLENKSGKCAHPWTARILFLLLKKREECKTSKVLNILMPGYKREVFENYFLIKIRYKKKTFEITQRVTKHSLPLVWIVQGPWFKWRIWGWSCSCIVNLVAEAPPLRRATLTIKRQGCSRHQTIHKEETFSMYVTDSWQSTWVI